MRPGKRDPRCPDCHGTGIYWETLASGFPWAVFCDCIAPPKPILNGVEVHP